MKDLKQKDGHVLISLRESEFFIFPQPQLLRKERTGLLPHVTR